MAAKLKLRKEKDSFLKEKLPPKITGLGFLFEEEKKTVLPTLELRDRFYVCILGTAGVQHVPARGAVFDQALAPKHHRAGRNMSFNTQTKLRYSFIGNNIFLLLNTEC